MGREGVDLFYTLNFQIMKRTISMMLLSVLCVIMALPAAALTAYPVGDLQYCMPYGETVEQTMFDYVHVYKPVDASINEAVIPESVTIGGKTFKVAEIRSSAFANCSSLASVTFPSSLTKIGNNAFQNCTALQSAVIPNSVTSIGNNAFAGCSALTQATLPESLAKISSSMFSNCKSLIAIDIPSSVNYIDSYAFSGCSSLISVVIPEGVTTLRANAFSYCSSLKSISIPSTITSLSDNLLAYCSNLTTVTLPSTLTSVGNWVFAYCTSLITMDLPEGVTSVGNYAFAYDTDLAKVCLPSTLTSVGSSAFEGCTALGGLLFAGSQPTFGSSALPKNAVLYVPEANVSQFDEIAKTQTVYGTFTVDGSDSRLHYYINSYAQACIAPDFEAYSGDITIPVEITRNQEYFVSEIGAGAFAGCKNLTSVTFAKSAGNPYGSQIHTINNSAFAGCTGLTSDAITLPSSLLDMGNHVFTACGGLKTMSIPENVRAFGEYVFSKCTALTGVEFLNSPTNLPNGTFMGCTGMRDYLLPKTLKKIGNLAFADCINLINTYIPQDVTSIGSEAYRNCPALKKVYVYATTPPTIQSNTFSQVNYDNATLYCPTTAESAYSGHEYWGLFLDRQTVDGDYPTSGIEDIVTDGATEEFYPCEVYSISGALVRSRASQNDVDNLEKGIYILRSGKQARKIAVR